MHVPLHIKNLAQKGYHFLLHSATARWVGNLVGGFGKVKGTVEENLEPKCKRNKAANIFTNQ